MKRILFKLKENIDKNILFELIGVFLYTIILQLAYVLIYENNNQYTIGFTLEYNFMRFINSFIVIVLIFLGNEKIDSDFIKFYNKLFIYLMLVPISVIYSLKDFSTIYYLCLIIEFALIIWGINLINKIKIKNHKEQNILKKISNINFTNYIYILFWIITIFIFGCCLKYNGLPKLTALNLYNVYEIRDEFYLPKYIQYLYDFVTKFILLFLIIVNLNKKNYKNIIFLIGILGMFFLWKGDKALLLSCPLIIFVYLFFSKIDYKKYFERNVIWLVIYACIISVICHLKGILLPASIFIIRLLIIPANLKFVYIDFFANHEKLGIVGTILNFVFKNNNPYSEIPYQNLISDIYFYKPEMFSNTGFLVEGFARWGYIGFIIIPIIYVIVMKILDKGAQNTSFAFNISMSIIPLMLLNDTFLIPSLTFGAIALLCFTSIVFKIDKLETNKIFDKIGLKLRRK